MNKSSSSRRGRPAHRKPEDAGNRTILIGVQLLQTVVQSTRPETLTEISKRVDMSPSRTHRYLTSLSQAGFLQHDPITGRYDIGLAAIELGVSAMAKLDTVRVASDFMRSLTEKTNLVSVLCVWGSNGPTVIKGEMGQMETAIRIREGSNISLLTTAAGRIFLAYLPPNEIKDVLARNIKDWNAKAAKMHRLTQHDVDRMREEVLLRGISCVVGIRNPSVAALSAPVFGPQGRLAFCIALIGVIGTVDTNLSGEPAQELRATAERLSRMLGSLPTDHALSPKLI
jgi:DNA-binding IclR family transcriptional regulator